MSSPGEPTPITPEAEARIRELQAIITDSQRRADKAQDEDIREALNLQAAGIGLKIARLRKGLPEDAPAEAAAEEELEPLPQPTPEQMQEAEMLVKRAMLEKQRGNRQVAGDLLKQAAEVAPGAATVLEALGDDCMERKQYEQAQAAYKAAHRADPKNPSIERKYAQTSMIGFSNLSFDEQMRLATSDNPFMQEGDSYASPKSAMFLSFLFPGMGQFVMRQNKKGATILGLCIVGTVLFALLAKTNGGRSLPTIAYLPLMLAIGSWMAGWIDASLQTKGKSRPDRPSRPVPPANLPFE